MWRVGIVVLVVLTAGTPTTMKDLTFLTRAGCLNTPDLASHLEGALTALKWRHDYQVVDVATLPKGDLRTGYPTPTLLWKDKDLFGLRTPTPPFLEPT